MKKHEEKYCPKCNSAFTCKTGDIGNCQCFTVKLTDDAKTFLSKTSFDCLCGNCLKKINLDIETAKKYQFPTHSVMFVEGLHYYKEDNLWVFTELYHTLRGHCCGNGCRHCVYGFHKKALI